MPGGLRTTQELQKKDRKSRTKVQRVSMASGGSCYRMAQEIGSMVTGSGVWTDGYF